MQHLVLLRPLEHAWLLLRKMRQKSTKEVGLATHPANVFPLAKPPSRKSRLRTGVPRQVHILQALI